MIVMIALLNDGAILSIAYDNVLYRNKPEAWNMRLVLAISTVLGVIGVVAAFGLFYLAERVFHFDRLHAQTLIYLKLSVAGHLTIFLTRTRGPFWSIRPAKILWIAVLGTQTIATLIAVYGLFMTPLGWKWAGFVWGYAIAWALINDRIKLLAYKIFDPVKAAPKPETKAEPKSEAKADAPTPAPKAEQPKPETKAEPKPEAKPDAPTPEAKPDQPKPEAKADQSKPEVKADAPTPEAKPDQPKPEAKAEAPTPAPKAEQPKPEAKADAPKPETKADQPKSEVKADAPSPAPKAEQPTPEAKADVPKPETKTESKSEAKTEPGPKVKAEPEPEAKADAPGPEAKADQPKPEAKDKTQPDATPQLIKRVHELYEELGRADVQSVQDWEKAHPELEEHESHK
jgi:H+-transporting ATPase